MTKQEELQLFIQNDTASIEDKRIIKEKIINENMKIVKHIAYSYYKKNHKQSLDDLISEGCVGICVAYDKFDYKRNIKFGSYAQFWIQEYVRSYYRDKFIRIPKYLFEIIYAVGRGDAEFTTLGEILLNKKRVELRDVHTIT